MSTAQIQKAKAVHQRTKTMTILLVEPDAELRVALQDALELSDGGFRVLAASSETQAVKFLQAFRIDAFVADLQPRGLATADLLVELARHAPDVPRVLLADDIVSAVVRSAMEDGRTEGILVKPFPPQALVDILRRKRPARKPGPKLNVLSIPGMN